jgi:DNA-binding MarR family transcriptional regulator
MLSTSRQLALAPRLRFVLARTARRLRQEAGGEIGPGVSAALATISDHGPLTPSELAARERIQRPTATRIIARLAEDGLIDRVRDEHDRRSSLISITPGGQALLEQLRARKDEFLSRWIEHLPAADRATLARAADLLESLLAEEDGNR